MEYRNLGTSDVKVSAITFGAWAIGGWMWGGAEHNDAIAAIHASLAEGVTSIDTAPIYGQGHSESIVGEAIQSVSRDKVQILTKFGMTWEGTKGQFAFDSQDNHGKDIKIYKYAGKESIIAECENSLKRLRTDYIDLYQIHWPDNTTPIEETFEAVLRLKEQGKIREAGVCNYNVADMKKANDVMNIVSNQVPFSMVERGIDTEVKPFCIENRKSILAYSPLQRGVLTGKIKPTHQFAAGDHRPTTKYYKPENIERINAFLAEIKPMAESKNATLAQLVLRWTIDHPGITVALAGARNADQAIQNARAAQLTLAPGEIDYINKKLGALQIVS
ncbi:aryl-alcohol dehydrogenase-like predicted oxidoreductase [Chitinophaga skermanii]|uniref:Aryl-alcohol dehydrogenase-like predicted oxidoreductase n=1 Tax=Chitinophaga skermanii TaxID=331697 RepID=A0A327QQK9_9BACT|nr:aldo/keto reductase [Chitinophaga skermanii]RAJ06876.1 aryl-alcohol dehydrogenase-like predicted oxidoreductase [Chitinophaga skermanii]